MERSSGNPMAVDRYHRPNRGPSRTYEVARMSETVELKAKAEFERKSAAMTRHGHTRSDAGVAGQSPTYITWQAMRARCRLSHRDSEAKYANRGITYDPSWDNFEQFLLDMGERPAGMTLDRVDNDGPYNARNCRWATPTQQARNRRNTRLNYGQAVEVAYRRLSGESCQSLALEFGCSESLPREIASGRTWKDALAEAEMMLGDANG